jgi:metal-responsive CopG/Arc/MetJ family transcriptional regulator
MKQISLTIPDKLYKESKEYAEEFGFKNMQEFILDIMREKVFYDNLPRYQKILERMKKGKGVTTMTQKEFKHYLENL